MLSIGKVGGGQADPSYYVEAVAHGGEDYYTGAGEAPGTWHGKGAAAQKLVGTVEDDKFIGALTVNPADGKTVLGYDLTFSAPKSVSILFGVGDQGLSRQVREAHDEAVRQALDYVERNACWTRRGRGGRQRLEGEGLTVAAFRHRTSRAGDPQLHTHAVVANATEAEGRATALDGQALYSHARTAGFLYQAALRGQLVERVGVEWHPVENGVAEIQGIPEEVIRHFSTRSTEIREHMARHGGRSPDSARLATLETRKAKEYDVPVRQLQEDWRARAAEFGLDQHQLASVLDGRIAGKPVEPDIKQSAETMATPGGITHQASTFDRRDALRDWAARHRDGAQVERLEQLADAWLKSPNAVRLEAGAWREHLGGPRFSTPDMLATERQLLTESKARKDTGVALGSEQVLTELGPETGLSEEQLALVRDVTRSGDGVQVIRAAAGTGKTRALHAARAVWEAEGVQVQGCALAARAAVELEQLAGIDSTTVAHLERDLDHGYGLPRSSVLIVDEAGMVGTRSIARLARHCAETDSKLLLVGDDHQLPEIDAGGAFRRLAKDLGATELRTVWRQDQAWDREALDRLRHGKVADWAEEYRDHGRLIAHPTAHGARQQLVTDWWHAARQPNSDAVMLAHRRVDVAELNGLARELMREDGRLSEEQIVTQEGQPFAVGDRVLTKQNDRRLNVVNGTRAEVTAIDTDRQALEIKLADGTERRLDAGYLERGSLAHGYALTAHAAQGATVDRAYVLGTDDLYQEWGYTALTRHRHEARFYVVSPGSVERAIPGLEPQPDPLTEDVAATLQRSGRKQTAHDLLDRAGPNSRYAHDANAAADRADARGDALQEKLDAVRPWQRSKSRELREAVEVQRRDAQQWREQPEAPAPITPAKPQREGRSIDPSELRTSLLANQPDLENTIGPRPTGLAGRDHWMRAATAAIHHDLVVPEPPAAALDLADIGFDL